MRVSFETADANGSGHLVEAGIDVFAIYDDTNIGINPTIPNIDNALLLYPNPAHDRLTIQLPANYALNPNMPLLLHDPQGRLLTQITLTQHQQTITLPQLPQGLYYYSIGDTRGKLVIW